MSPPSFINTFLDSPLLIGQRDRDYELFLKWASDPKLRIPKKSLSKFRAWMSRTSEYDFDILDGGMYPAIYDVLPDCGIKMELKNAEVISDELSQTANECLSKIGLHHLNLGNQVNLKTLPWWGLEALKKLPLFKTFVGKLSTSKAVGRGGHTGHQERGWEIYGDEFTCLLIYHEQKTAYLCSYDQILMWKDMLWGRFNVSIACQVIYNSPTLIDTIGRLLGWCFDCLETYGNEGYELLKNIESLTKTNIVESSDPVFSSNGTHSKMADVVREKEKSLSGGDTPLTEKILNILKNDRPLVEAVELFGLQKLSGHPCVDPSRGGRKVREIACVPKLYSPANCAQVRNNFCRMYTEGYVRKKSKWPPLHFPKNTRHTRLFQLASLQETRLTSHSYPLEDWNGVRFERHHDFEYYPNFTDLMDDKAISYYRDQISYTWRRGKVPRSNKRLLLEMLSVPEVSIRKIVNTVRSGKIPFSWLVVSLYPKEREFKLEPRMFAMMVLEMRTFFTATEANVAENVFPFLPPQTMTLSKQEIVERFHEVTVDPSNETLSRLYGEFDVTSWNSNFQAPIVDPITRDVGDMHGEDNIFQVLHHFFEKCAVFVRVADNEPPGIEEAQSPFYDLPSNSNDLIWGNHIAGVEGIDQKKWTLVTYAIIDLALRSLGISYHLIGQADNQIFVALIDCEGQFDREAYIKEMSGKIVDRVDEELRKAGHSSKKEECILSTTVITYSKDVYIRGVEYYTSLKALSRVFPNSASDFPSVNNSVGALSSQCLAASEKMKNPLAAYRIWAFHAGWYLMTLNKGVVVEASRMSKEVLSITDSKMAKRILMLPGELGGLSVLPVTSLLYKGGGDPLSKAYASLALMSRVDKTAARLMAALHSRQWFHKSPDLSSLLDDPYSLPIHRARTPEMAIQREGLEAIRGRAKNKNIQELCSEKVDSYEKDLTQALLQVRPFNPALLSDLKSDSVVGVKKQVAKMFITTRTVQTLLQKQSEANACSKILAAGAGYSSSTIWNLSRLPQVDKISVCIFSEVEDLRSSWSPDGQHKIVGLTTLTPFDGHISFSKGPAQVEGVKAYRTCPKYQSCEFSRGIEAPYLGRPTVEKRSVHGYKIIASSSPERAVARLSRVATQPGVGSSMEELIGSICQTRANVDFRQLISLLGRSYGGTIDHRYTALMGTRGANFLGGTAFPSQCILSTDDAPPISGGAEDYPIMVQEWMVSALSFLYHEARFNPDTKMCSISIPEDILSPLDDTEIVSPQTVQHKDVILRSNPMVYADTIYLRKLLDIGVTSLIGSLPAVDLQDSSRSYHLRKLVRSSLTTSRSAASVADRGSGVIHLSLDILELRGFGLRRVFESAAIEVARFAVESLYARSQGEVRWSPVPLVMSLSESIARALHTSFYHPLFKSDPMVVEYGLNAPMAYSIGQSTAMTRVRNFVSNAALSHVANPSSVLFSDPLCLFGDDKEGEAVSEILSVITLSYHKSLLLGEVQLSEVYQVLRVQMPKEMRSGKEESDQLRRLETIVSRILLWAEDHNVHSMIVSFSLISRGRKVLKTEVPVREAIREARRFPPPPGWSNTVTLAGHQPFPSASAIVQSSDSITSSSLLVSPTWSDFVTTQELDLFSFDRLVGRSYGKESSAGYSYAGITDLTISTTVLNVGCGYGSGAAVLLANSCMFLVGLDLDDDLRHQSVLSSNLTPPAINHVGCESRFARYPPGYDGGGNFFDNRVVQRCREMAGAKSIVVVDIPLQSRESIFSLITSLSSYSSDVKFAIRVIQRNRSISDIYNSLKESCSTLECRVVFSTGSMSEVWVVGQARWGLHLLPCSSYDPGPLPYNDCKDYNLSYLGGGTHYLQMTLLSPLGMGSLTEVDMYVHRMAHLLSASIGEQEHRFTFRQWTEVLHAFAVSQLISSPNPRGEFQQILNESTIKIALGSGHVELVVNRSLLRTLSRVAPRLL